MCMPARMQYCKSLSNCVPKGLMIAARQFIAWYGCENRNRPGGYGMIRSERRAIIQKINPTGVPDQTVPYGTDCLFNVFQTINCLATIINPYGTKTANTHPGIRLQRSGPADSRTRTTTRRERKRLRGKALGYVLAPLRGTPTHETTSDCRSFA